MAGTVEKLLRRLADGHEHSGPQLAADLGVTRAAVWKTVQQLADLGLEVQAERGKGYRLPAALEFLGADLLEGQLEGCTRDSLESLEVFWSLDSTSDYLLREPAVRPGFSRACFAEFQTGGRGRRGRRWYAPIGHGICVSLSWSFASSPANLSCLGLAAGVGVLRAAQRAGAREAQLKWPNDVVLDGKKLAGILIDVQGEAGGPLRVVVGVGLNYKFTAAAASQIVAAGGLSPVAIADAAGDELWSRSKTAATLVDELHGVLVEFSGRGFSGLAADWRAADYLAGRRVVVTADTGELAGIVRGIGADGRLQLETEGGIQHIVNGDVSVRPVS